MDGIVADQVLVPQEHEQFYSERVLRLPGTFLSFIPPSVMTEPAKQEDKFVFGVFNNPAKFSDSCYRMWAAILNGATGTEIMFKYHNLHDPWVQKQIRGRFEDLGVEPSRITFVPFVEDSAHLATIAKAHVALDTFPYTGATTTLDCLSVGVPVVTRIGDRYASRMSASLLNAVGRTETIVSSEEEYVERAIGLAEDRSALLSARTGLREALLNSPVCDPASFANGFYETLHELL